MGISKKIADKAHTLFIRYGIRSISMDDIAAGLGISKKTIYKFYPNKGSLVDALVNKAADKHIYHCTQLMANSRDAIMELYLLLIYAGEFYNTLNPMIIHDLEKNYAWGYQKIEDHKNLFFHPTLKASIDRGIKERVYRDDFDVDVITRFFIESLNLIFDPEIFQQGHQPKFKHPEELFACLISGIVTTSGMELINVYKNQKDIMLSSIDESYINF